MFRSDIDLAVEASLAAIADVGLRPDDIDGIAAYPGGGISAYPGFAGPGVAEMCDALGLSVNWHLGAYEGPGQAMTLFAACLAIAAGLCRHVLAYRTVTEGTAQALTRLRQRRGQLRRVLARTLGDHDRGKEVSGGRADQGQLGPTPPPKALRALAVHKQNKPRPADSAGPSHHWPLRVWEQSVR